jgi:hypothetical protein
MKSKPVLFIIATFIIGFILGMLTSAQIRYHKLNPVRVFFSQDRFREGFYRIIQPDDAQKARIDVVLDKYARINNELQTSFRKELDASMREFRKEIDTYLTKEQIARLREMDERRQKIIRHNRMIHAGDSLNFRGGPRHYHQGRPSPGDEPYDPSSGRPGIQDSVGNK